MPKGTTIFSTYIIMNSCQLGCVAHLLCKLDNLGVAKFESKMHSSKTATVGRTNDLHFWLIWGCVIEHGYLLLKSLLWCWQSQLMPTPCLPKLASMHTASPVDVPVCTNLLLDSDKHLKLAISYHPSAGQTAADVSTYCLGMRGTISSTSDSCLISCMSASAHLRLSARREPFFRQGLAFISAV